MTEPSDQADPEEGEISLQDLIDPDTGDLTLDGRIGYTLTALEISYLLQEGNPTKAEVAAVKKIGKWRKISGFAASGFLGVFLKSLSETLSRPEVTPEAFLTPTTVIFFLLTLGAGAFFLSTNSDASDLEKEVAGTGTTYQEVISKIAS